MGFALLIAAALAATGWQFQTQADPLGHPIYVAASLPDPEKPQAFLRFSCGGIIGVELQYNLGKPAFEGSDFSTGEPQWEDVSFTFPEGPYPTTSKRAPITDGVGTFEIKGGDAMFIVKLFRSGGSVTIKQGPQESAFSLEAAAGPINAVIDQCPFKYNDQ
ncbi:MAG: hypothetical protein ABL973_20925 [Micropepsaceae bacterium]